MKEAWQWQEAEIQTLIREQRKEDLRLEYKRSDSLARSDGKKNEITKDVSAMANSAGGVIVYGIDEQKRSNGPIQLDAGIDPNEITPEWLEQVIDSGVQRRIEGIHVNTIEIRSTGRVVYVVSVPQSNRAPHMAADHRYHKRLGTTTALMEEYEIRDVGHRSESPDLRLDIRARHLVAPDNVLLEPFISNDSAEPVLYATFRLYVEAIPPLQLKPNIHWSRLEDVEMRWNGENRTQFQVARFSWSVPTFNPILEGEQYSMHSVQLSLGVPFNSVTEVQTYSIGWELRTPKALPKLQGAKLRLDKAGPHIVGQFALARP